MLNSRCTGRAGPIAQNLNTLGLRMPARQPLKCHCPRAHAPALIHCSLMGWEDLEVVDPESEKAKKGEEATATGLLEQVRRLLAVAFLARRCSIALRLLMILLLGSVSALGCVFGLSVKIPLMRAKTEAVACIVSTRSTYQEWYHV